MKKLLSAFLATLLLTSPALAFTSKDDENLDFKNAVGSHYYDAYGNRCNDGQVGYYDGETSAGLSSLQSAFVDQYHDIAETLSIEFGIPWETVIAQGILESGAGTSNFAKERNNFFGIGAFDSNPDHAYSYPTPTAGWRGYYENIQKTSTYRNHGAFNYPNDPYKYLEAIKSAGYATDPNYVSKVGKLIAAIENRATEKNWKTSKQLTEEHPEMLQAAKDNQAGAKTADVNGATEIMGCITDLEGNGNIAATAVKLAWPNPDNTCASNNNWSANPSACYSDIKPDYKSAMEALWGSQPLSYYQDCGHFVATVIRSSAADPNFPASGTSSMLPYLQGASNWTEIENLGNTSNLQPGDVFVLNNGSSGHIMIFTGDTEFGNNASASLGERTGNMGNIYFSDRRGSYHIFRLTGGGNDV